MRAGAAILVAAAAAAVAAPGGGGAVLDLSDVRAAVDAGVEGGGGGDRRALKAYLRLDRRLDRASAKGLPDDLKKLGAVVKECGRSLAGDGALTAARDASLDAAAGAVDAADAAVVSFTDLLDSESDRARVLGAAVRARALGRAGDDLLLDGNGAGAVRAWKRAAKKFTAADALARRLRAKAMAGDPAWDVPLRDIGGALLSVWGEPGPAPALYTVGADDGDGPLFLHLAHAGEGWVRVKAADSGDLWWVTGVPGAGVWASGTGGLVVAYDPATGAVADRSTGVDATLYGVWGSGGSDVWAVGGDPDGVGPLPALLHFDGDDWTPVAPPAEAAGRMLFKVWGTAANDVWACGQGGVILHFDGTAWSVVPSGTPSTLLTVHGPSPVTAVGGGGVAAVAVERGGAGTFAPVSVPAATPSLNGVFVPVTGDAVAVGFTRTVLRRGDAGWEPLPGVPTASRDLHAVWIDDEGNAVMAGGNLFSLATGTLVTWGKRTLPTEILPAVSYRARVADILYLNCAISGCHLAPFTNEGLDFTTPEVSREGTVAIPARQSPLLRVSPGRPSRSYLWHKLEGTHEAVGGSGDRMPQGEDPLPAEARLAVRTWILAGARDD